MGLKLRAICGARQNGPKSMRLNLLGLKMPGHGDALIGAGIPA